MVHFLSISQIDAVCSWYILFIINRSYHDRIFKVSWINIPNCYDNCTRKGAELAKLLMLELKVGKVLRKTLIYFVTEWLRCWSPSQNFIAFVMFKEIRVFSCQHCDFYYIFYLVRHLFSLDCVSILILHQRSFLIISVLFSHCFSLFSESCLIFVFVGDLTRLWFRSYSSVAFCTYV